MKGQVFKKIPKSSEKLPILDFKKSPKSSEKRPILVFKKSPKSSENCPINVQVAQVFQKSPNTGQMRVTLGRDARARINFGFMRTRPLGFLANRLFRLAQLAYQ
jgi:hypothetical protein